MFNDIKGAGFGVLETNIVCLVCYGIEMPFSEEIVSPAAIVAGEGSTIEIAFGSAISFRINVLLPLLY